MFQNVIDKLKSYIKTKKFLVLAVLLFFAVNFFVLYNTFSEKTTSIIWDGTVAKRFNKGTGSASDPYIIKNGSELAYFFTVINSEDSSEYFNKFYELNNNIDLNGYDFSFADVKTFSGNFDGKGYSIFNFKLSKYYLDEEGKIASISLFDSLYSAKIQNVNIHDVDIIVKESDVLNKNLAKSTVSDDENENIETLETTNDSEISKEENKNTEDNSVTNENPTSNDDTKKDDNNTDNSSATDEVIDGEKTTDEDKNSNENSTNPDENSDSSDNTTGENAGENTDDTNSENVEGETTNDIANEEENIEDEVIENKVERIEVSFLAKNVEQSVIKNLNLNKINVLFTGKEENISSSLFILNDIDGNTFSNININGTSSANDTSVLIRNYNNAKLENIIYMSNHLDLVFNHKVSDDSAYEYSINNGKLTFNDNIPVKAILQILNSKSDFNWVFEKNAFRIQNKGVDDTLPGKKIALKKAVRSAPSAHDSGREGSIVYVNDYESDANYYEGLNYTHSNNGALPTTERKNIYNDSNLVYTQLHYYGRDYDNNNVGAISNTSGEDENQFIYYKIYEVNNNGTASNKSDDYVEIELIDNPFQNRPDGKAFNGWVTDYVGAEIYLNKDIYTRFIKIPVTYNGDVPNNITANIYSSWTDGLHLTTTSLRNLSNNNLRAYGFTAVTSVETVYDSINGLYTRRTVYRYYDYPDGAVNANGVELNGYCNTYGGCTCYVPASGNYVSGTTYYELSNGTMTQTTVSSHQELEGELSIGDSTAGFYRRVNLPNGTNLAGYYDTTGNMYTSGSASSYDTYYDLIQFYDANGDMEVAGMEEYYYLTTRDTTIVRMSANITNVWRDTVTRPFTLTTIDNGTNNYNRYYWSIQNSIVQAYSDIRIEDMKVYGATINNTGASPSGSTYSQLYGNYNNVKVGRGITQYNTSRTTFSNIAGGNNSTSTQGSSSNITKYRLIIESGMLNTASSTTLSVNSSKTIYVNEITTYGCDYDRVEKDNDNLKVSFTISAMWSGSNYSTHNYDVALQTIIKSGTFGTSKYNFATGMYVSGRGYANIYTASSVTIEGGHIYNVNGGPSPKSTNKSINTVYIYMKGGSADILVGGAGQSQTYGNRIIQVTDGIVNYSVFGGSNGVTGSDGSDNTNGKLDGDSYVYIGGNATIGDTSLGSNAIEPESLVEAGSVFGNGNGNTSSKTIGTVNNSNIIIDGSATINKNVYGGGNYGAAGQNGTGKTYNLNIIIHDGEIKGSVYGGGNNAGAGTITTNANNSNTANINITMDGGSVSGSVYGGSCAKGVVNGNTNVTITAGTVYTDVYGGGEGGYQSDDDPGTYVTKNVNVTIGNSSGGPNINGTVYGGSAYGTVNEGEVSSTANSYSVDVTVNNGTILGSVFGGAKGSTTFTPNVNGDVNVTINNGTIPNVFGGCDEAGEPLGDVVVTINGGNITNAYGGGNKTSVGNTSIYLEGGSVSTLYGGSNQRGVVDESHVYIDGGTVGTVFGGNNEGGTCTESNVNLNGGTINGIVYGGGNLVDTGTTNVNIKNINNTLSAVYGGGNKAGATSTNITLSNASSPNNINITNVYGGSNQLGDVDSSTITMNKGSVTNLYGGNNDGGTTTTTNITLNNGTVTTLFGGGNDAVSGTSHITQTGGSVTTMFGGGNKADMSGDTNISVSGGSITTALYGGGNEGAVTGDTNVLITNMSGTLPAVYGGGNKAGASDTNITLGDSTNGTINITNVYGGSNQLGNVDSSTITMNKGTVTSLYGGNNDGGTTTTTNITLNNGTVTTLFGGGNKAISGTSHVTQTGGSVTTMFGGGNQAAMSGNTNISVSGGSVTTALYGGGNEGAVTGNTNVLITNMGGTLPALYGGGNKAGASNTNITLGDSTNGTINITNVYGGSNQLGNITNSTITMNKGTVTSLYGANNAGGTTSSTDVNVLGGNVGTIYGGGNQAHVGNTNVDVQDATVGTIYGGGNAANVTASVILSVANSNVTDNVYGGGNQGTVSGNTTVTIDGTTIAGSTFGAGNGQTAHVAGNSNLTITDSTISSAVYGGGNEGTVGGNTTVNISGTTIAGSTFAAGNGQLANVTGNSSITIDDSTISSSIYGGGNEGTVGGSTDVIINDTSISGSAYAGGNGSHATVTGNTSIIVGGTSVVGTPQCSVLSQCSVFGGGNAAITGSELVNNSLASVKITGATVYGNVYGGANTSKVYGRSDVNIGADVQLSGIITRGNVSIKGTVFGGGEANASGSDEYDWTFVSVTKGIDVNINGNNYPTFEILGSIFGSGNASTTTGLSEVVIKNYGTFSNPQRNVSIQRTDYLKLDNSAIVLEGATDRENEYSDVLFTLSRIKRLDLTNNSTLFLETGANLLEEFNSLTSTGAKAAVNIDEENKTVTKNVDNRVYMFIDKKLNIAKDQNVTDYGEVNGMSFFGMYKYNSNGDINVGIYNDYAYDETLNWGDVFDNVSSYVLGLHEANHDIKVDGFYTNYIQEDTGKNKIDYIEPTPPSGPLYMWTIGEGVIEYEIDLSASKYSTLGTAELSLIDFTHPNTTFEILGFDYSELDSSVRLVPKTNIKKIADTDQEADTIMGLTMETSNIGWLVNGNTTFLTHVANPEDAVVGTESYVGGNNASSPTLLFNLHHSKNISSTGDLGRVRIQLTSIRQIDALTKETKRLIITVNLSKALISTVNYEGAMTAGRKYELFASTATNISSSSSISVYYSLFNSGESIYRNGYHRALFSNYVFPLNTKITMIDYSGNNPEYYYHVINQNDVDAATAQMQSDNEASYNISMFETMGAENSGVYYNDAAKNIAYYNSTANYCNEEFIFIIDFGDTNINANSLANQLLFGIRDSDEETIYGVLGNQYSVLTYNIYANKDAIIDMDGTISSNKIYNGESVIADLTIDYTQEMVGSTVIYDTHYFDSKLGIKISLINSDGEVVTGTTLLGLYYTIDGVRYDPNIDGTTRIKIADKVDSAEKWVIINTGTSTIASGNYTLRFESFGSPDGIYYGLTSSDTKDFAIEIVNEIYGLDVNTSAEEMIIDSLTGNNANGTNTIVYNLNYNSGLANPNIRFKMYRRSYEHIDDTNYILVDAQDYFDNAFQPTSNEKEYKIITSPGEHNSYTFTLNEELITGTYKMEFILYDEDASIGSVEKYIIIK